jgi:excisionase family DNA binding protein
LSEDFVPLPLKPKFLKDLKTWNPDREKRAREMKKRTALTTGEVAVHCHVTPDAVLYWITTGKLKANITPGGHRRIPLEEFQAFLQLNALPPL